MRKRVVSRTINMVNGVALVIVDDTINRCEFDAPEAVCRDLNFLRAYMGITNGWIAKIEVNHTYIAKAVMDEVKFILVSSIEVVRGGSDNE